MQSLDVLDFSVIHLSAYERSSHKHRYGSAWYSVRAVRTAACFIFILCGELQSCEVLLQSC
jgi:hypothetical protein